MGEAGSDVSSRWDQELADWLVGKYALVGLTYLDADGEFLSQHQVHGRVKSASQTEGIVLDRAGQPEGVDYRLPADTAVFEPASPGKYRLRSTGEVVVDPDVLATWTVSKTASPSGEGR